MRFRSIEEEALSKREHVRALIEAAEELDVIASFFGTPAGNVLYRILERDVAAWQTGGSWGNLDDEAKREQGRALRSKQLLEYFNSAEEQARNFRTEAQRLTTLLEAAADQGRISRV